MKYIVLMFTLIAFLVCVYFLNLSDRFVVIGIIYMFLLLGGAALKVYPNTQSALTRDIGWGMLAAALISIIALFAYIVGMFCYRYM